MALSIYSENALAACLANMSIAKEIVGHLGGLSGSASSTTFGVLGATPVARQATYTQTYSTADRTVDAALTDNTTGTSATTTLAAGVGISHLFVSHTFIGGTSAVEPITNWTPGYKFKILGWDCVTSVLLVGGGGSRVANMEIGTTDVGTVPSTITIPIANAAVGTVTAGTAVSGANTGTSSDNISIEIAAGGTAFTAGSVMFMIRIQNMDMADAIAGLVSHINDRTQALNAVIDDLQSFGFAG